MSTTRLAPALAFAGALTPCLLALAASEASEPVVVEIAPSLQHLDPRALRQAIARELRTEALTAGSPDSPRARGTLLLERLPSGELRMTYRARSGSSLSRKMRLPSEPDAQLTTIALLAGNLARDEAAELLASLRAARASSSAPASASSEASAGALPATSASSSASAPVSAPASASAGGATSASPGASASAPESAPMPAPTPTTTEKPAAPAGGCSKTHAHQEPVRLQLVPGVGFPGGSSPAHTTLALSLAGKTEEVRDGAHLGLLVFNSGDASWVTAGALGAAVGGKIRGAALGGLVQVGVCDAEGFLGGGVLSLHRGNLEGAQGAGLVSVAQGKVSGFQGAGLVSVARGGVHGFQGAGMLSLAGDVEGLQMAPVNIAGRVKGVQLGLINLADEVDGIAIGLFSLAGNTRLQPLLWMSPRPRFNLGLKMTTGYAYQIINSSYHRTNEAPLYGLGYTVGLHFPRGPLFLDVDVGYHQLFPNLHLDTERDAPRWKDQHEHLIKTRALLGFEFARHLGVFAGLGAVMPLDDGPRDQDRWIGSEWTIGLQL